MKIAACGRDEVSAEDKAEPAKGEAAILIVDDSSVDRRVAGAIVERVTGLRCEYAEDGVQAMAAIARERPCLVLTDLQMPGMDGLALVKEVRRRYPAVPVILMTAHGSEEVAMEALRAGASNYIPKRLLAHDLLPTIRQVLSVTSKVWKRERLRGALRHRTALWRLENDPGLIAPLVELMLEDLAAMQLNDETSGMRVGVALHEALTNALFHGNLELSSDLRQEDESHYYRAAEQRRALEPFCTRSLAVEATLDRKSARYVIRDEGPGFDTTRLDKPADPEDLLRIGGRGLLLIRAFMDEVWYNSVGNEITMIKHASAAP
ncbi:MAG: response regulator [Isosphaeraceae bacterium]|nr:response regulator [Isosphaeraceae bacterium]